MPSKKIRPLIIRPQVQRYVEKAPIFMIQQQHLGKGGSGPKAPPPPPPVPTLPDAQKKANEERRKLAARGEVGQASTILTPVQNQPGSNAGAQKKLTGQ